MNMRVFFFILALLSLPGACLGQDVTDIVVEPGDLPDFTGFWEVDYRLSESPEDKLKYLYEITRSHHQRQISRHDQNFNAVQTARAELQGLIDLGRLAEIITRPQVLTIEQSREDILVQRQGNFSLTCDFQNPEVTNNALGKEVCAWDHDQLVFHLALPGGLAVNHRLAISPDRQRLNVATTVSSAGIAERFSINRVYMPFEPGKGMYKCEYTLAKKKTCYLGAPD